MTDSIYQEHLTYVRSVARERLLLGGGFSNAAGGMILFEAVDLDEAQEIVRSDPIIERGFYRCDLFVWELAEVSPDRRR